MECSICCGMKHPVVHVHSSLCVCHSHDTLPKCPGMDTFHKPKHSESFSGVFHILMKKKVKAGRGSLGCNAWEFLVTKLSTCENIDEQ